MSKITAIQAQKRNPQRVNVYLDGDYAFAAARIVAAWLEVGQELSESDLARLRSEDEVETAFQRALRLLNYRPRSAAEIEHKLEEKGYDAPVIAAVVERLERGGLVNDPQFARDWVDNRSSFRPRSHRVMRLELRRKGLAEDVIEDALETADDEEDLAYAAARRYMRRLARLERLEFRNKLGQHLARLGFGYGVIAEIIPRCWAEVQAEQAPTEKHDANEQEDGR